MEQDERKAFSFPILPAALNLANPVNPVYIFSGC
jgi:hypothetical protein